MDTTLDLNVSTVLPNEKNRLKYSNVLQMAFHKSIKLLLMQQVSKLSVFLESLGIFFHG